MKVAGINDGTIFRILKFTIRCFYLAISVSQQINTYFPPK